MTGITLSRTQKINIKIFEAMRDLNRYATATPLTAQGKRKASQIHGHLKKASDILEAEFGGELP